MSINFYPENKIFKLDTLTTSYVFQRNYLRLAGLDPNKRYLNEQTGQILSGDTLMRAGLNIRNILKDYDSQVYHFIAID